MIRVSTYAGRVARWVVDAVMGNGLAQREQEATEGGSIPDGMPDLARQVAADGCVLLSNDGCLPLDPAEEVAVFGRNQIDWFAMGHGSGGDVHPPYTTNLLDGLDRIGANYNHVLAQMYRTWCEDPQTAADPGWWGHWPTYLPQMPVDAGLAQAAASSSRAAIVVIGRNAGEDLDLPLSPGGYYLTDEEMALVEVVCSTFEHTVIVVNASNAMDLGWLEPLGDRVSAVLLAWQGGMEAGNAVADVLYGNTCPGGKLACTFARSYNDYPSSASFGASGRVAYTEDFRVGYRHFHLHAPDAVLFSFGHGLSYTSFLLEPVGLVWQKDVLVATVRVTNTGSCTGRDVVQLWCDLPEGALAKPRCVLAAFAKTRPLAPGEHQNVVLRSNLQTLSSFDEHVHAFALEQGTYKLWVHDGTDVERTDAWVFELEQTRTFAERMPICSPTVDLRDRILAHLPSELAPTDDASVTFIDVANGTATLEAFVAQLETEDLEGLTCGEGAMNSTLGVPGNAGAFGGVTKRLRNLGVPAAICADGPSGARLQRHASLVPSATTLASTWDIELVEQLFALMGCELHDAGVDVLLAPGMNIQRDPRCGRNFEYFSEDPLVTGHMAAAVVRGLQSAKVSACPKHLACNNQESHRNTSDSVVSERALREIYLRGFEICVRESKPDVLMTSYNKVNGVYAHYNFDLATTVLRDEWGFEGPVITDWWMKPGRSPEFPGLRDNAYRLRAGVDMLMPGNMSHILPIRMRPRDVTHAELQRTALRVLAFLLVVEHRRRREVMQALPEL